MRPFPGKLEREKSQAHPFILSDEQRVWMIETFPVTENSRMMAAMGVSCGTLIKMAHRLGLTKSEDGMRAIQRRKGDGHRQRCHHYKVLLMSGYTIDGYRHLRVQPYSKRQAHIRYNAGKRGYLLDEDISEGSAGRYTIYYDDETKRSERFEATCVRNGFKIMRDE